MIYQNINYKSEWYEQIKPDYKAFDERLPEYWEMKYLDRWADILKYLPDEQIIDAKVLDVGCGLGRALSYFKSFGAKIIGVEPSDYAISNNRLDANELIHGHFQDVDIKEQFDVIHIEQVLSHISDADAVIAKCAQILAPDGVLCIEEPNDGNPLQKRLEPKVGQYWITPDHVNYFNYASLEKLLTRHGFKVVDKSCTFPMELFHMMGLEYLGNDLMGYTVHEMRFKLEAMLGEKLRKELLKMFAERGLGRDIVLVAKKLDDAVFDPELAQELEVARGVFR